MYKCRLCNQEFDENYTFKRHLFIYHTNIELVTKYEMNFEHIIGPYVLTRLRNPVFNAIRQGRFIEWLKCILKTKTEGDYENLDFNRSLLFDPDK